MLKEEVKPEIIIIKRKRGGEEGHHGGVWKIAYADFMTAMMAFFLVMWLVNASNEETRSQVASYFNPVKLVDSTAQPRGLDEKENNDKSAERAGEAASDSQDKKGNQEEGDKSAGDNKEKQKGEAELFRSPMESLDKIAGGPPKNKSDRAEGSKSGANIGDMKVYQYRDPFAPKNWKVLKVEKLDVKAKTKSAKEIKKAPKPVMVTNVAYQPKKLPGGKKDKIETSKSKKEKLGKNRKEKVIKPAPKKGQRARKASPKQERVKRLSRLKSKILAVNRGKGPRVEVIQTKHGILVSLTDDAKFGMFKVASAKPAKEMVLFMEKIANVLASKSGKIIIRGHTDARPFNSKDYDNWRLSTARAQIARYMLVRGGIKDERFARIEGYADRKLKFPDKPYDARNRRIEILILDKGK